MKYLGSTPSSAPKSGCQKASNSGTFAHASKLVAATPESQPYLEDVLEVDSSSVSAILSFSPLVIERLWLPVIVVIQQLPLVSGWVLQVTPVIYAP